MMAKNEARVNKVMEMLSSILCKTLVKRVIFAVLLAYGVDRATARKDLDLSYKSAKKYEELLDSDGYGQLLHRSERKRGSDLDDFKDLIFGELDSGAYRTLREIAVMIEEKTGLRRSRNRIQIFIRKHGYKPLKVGFFPCEGGWRKTTDVLPRNP